MPQDRRAQVAPKPPRTGLWQPVQTWVTDETVTWKVFYPGKVKKK